MIEPTLTPAGIPPAPRLTIPARTVLAGIAVLCGRAGLAAPAADTVEFAADGCRVTLTAASISELSAWYDALSPRGVAVGGRYETGADGELLILGGLDWVLSVGQVPGCPGIQLSVIAETTAFEVLPDTELVRSMCPWAVRLTAAGTAVAA
ncbi:hypothetical protein ACIG0C_36415 [Kitasatospora aureofaciens]|uniref:hypothetical protein n=1 Tax=Kitasatospora aureofaciens TaxID=1894 RepID=UPI0037C9109A